MGVEGTGRRQGFGGRGRSADARAPRQRKMPAGAMRLDCDTECRHEAVGGFVLRCKVHVDLRGAWVGVAMTPCRQPREPVRSGRFVGGRSANGLQSLHQHPLLDGRHASRLLVLVAVNLRPDLLLGAVAFPHPKARAPVTFGLWILIKPLRRSDRSHRWAY